MKVQTMINKLFGKSRVADYMEVHVEEDDETLVEYWAIDAEEDACEPEYFVRVHSTGVCTIADISGKTLLETTDTKELKNKLKVLAQQLG